MLELTFEGQTGVEDGRCYRHGMRGVRRPSSLKEVGGLGYSAERCRHCLHLEIKSPFLSGAWGEGPHLGRGALPEEGQSPFQQGAG